MLGKLRSAIEDQTILDEAHGLLDARFARVLSYMVEPTRSDSHLLYGADC